MSIISPRLLITDDDRDFRETLRDVFEPRGFRTLLAADGEQALWIAAREQIHVVLMDQHMPRLTGVETARQIKQQFADLPCILISAGLDDEVMAQAAAIPMFTVLQKPVKFVELTQTVSSALWQVYNWTPQHRDPRS